MNHKDLINSIGNAVNYLTTFHAGLEYSVNGNTITITENGEGKFIITIEEKETHQEE